MNASTIDTPAAVRSLEAAGIETRHAEAIVNTVGDAAGAGHNAVRKRGCHALAWNGPSSCVRVDFVPCAAGDFTRHSERDCGRH